MLLYYVLAAATIPARVMRCTCASCALSPPSPRSFVAPHTLAAALSCLVPSPHRSSTSPPLPRG